MLRLSLVSAAVGLILLVGCNETDTDSVAFSARPYDAGRAGRRLGRDAGTSQSTIPMDDAGSIAPDPEDDAGSIEPVPEEPSSGSVVLLEDDFESYSVGVAWGDGTTRGPWRSLYQGYGTTMVEQDGTRVLSQSPTPSTSLGETHASLVLSQLVVEGDFTLSARLRTVQQLRTPTPNAWEVAWVLWHYTDEGHFYYFAPKTNGWELAKVDNSRVDPNGPACTWPSYENCRYPGAQRYLATGTSPTFPVGRFYEVRVTQKLDTMTVWVDGQSIVTFTDHETPYHSGAIGLYNEDAHVHFDNIRVTR